MMKYLLARINNIKCDRGEIFLFLFLSFHECKAIADFLEKRNCFNDFKLKVKYHKDNGEFFACPNSITNLVRFGIIRSPTFYRIYYYALEADNLEVFKMLLAVDVVQLEDILFEAFYYKSVEIFKFMCDFPGVSHFSIREGKNIFEYVLLNYDHLEDTVSMCKFIFDKMKDKMNIEDVYRAIALSPFKGKLVKYTLPNDYVMNNGISFLADSMHRCDIEMAFKLNKNGFLYINRYHKSVANFFLSTFKSFMKYYDNMKSIAETFFEKSEKVFIAELLVPGINEIAVSKELIPYFAESEKIDINPIFMKIIKLIRNMFNLFWLKNLMRHPKLRVETVIQAFYELAIKDDLCEYYFNSMKLMLEYYKSEIQNNELTRKLIFIKIRGENIQKYFKLIKLLHKNNIYDQENLADHFQLIIQNVKAVEPHYFKLSIKEIFESTIKLTKVFELILNQFNDKYIEKCILVSVQFLLNQLSKSTKINYLELLVYFLRKYEFDYQKVNIVSRILNFKNEVVSLKLLELIKQNENINLTRYDLFLYDFPLHAAIIRNKVDVVKILCEFKVVNLHLINSSGFTPLALSKKEGRKEIYSIIAKKIRSNKFNNINEEN